MVNYVYDSWGKQVSISGSLADSVGEHNPFRYKGYYYDHETGFYYLQSRYYDPEIRRFINADALIGKTGSLSSHNMFAYYGNEAINRLDPSGFAWYYPFNQYSDTGLKKKSYPFGAGSTVVHQSKQEKELSPPFINAFISVKTGTRESRTVSKKGDSSRPISVYAKGRSDNYFLSSVGIKINISSCTLNTSLGLDNIGISGSINNSDRTSSFSVTTDLSQLKTGFEYSETIKWDQNTDMSEYTNISITAACLLTALMLVCSGQ